MIRNVIKTMKKKYRMLQKHKTVLLVQYRDESEIFPEAVICEMRPEG